MEFIVPNELENVNIQEYFPQVLQYYQLVSDENSSTTDNDIVFVKCENLLETANNQESIIEELNNESILQTDDIENIQIEDDSLINSPNLESVTLIDGSTAYLAVVPEDQYWHVKLSDGNYGLVQLKVQSLLSENNSEAVDSNDNPEELTSNKNWKKNRSHLCTYEGCGKTYTTLHHLKVHERTHTGSKPYKCEYSNCDKAFATTYSLKTHLRTHTGEKPYKCSTCGKPFKTSGDLQKHIRIHTGERPFLCPYEGCNQSFTTSNIRKVHLRTHTGERPYKCDVLECGKTFVSATNYKNHMRIHSGEKPYVCKEIGCNKRFTEYSSLYKHQIVHKVKKQKSCTICGKLYRQNSTLVQHMKVIHSISDNKSTSSDILDNVCSTHTENSSSAEDAINSNSCMLDHSSNIMFDSNVILDSTNTESLDVSSNDEVLITDMQGNPVILRKLFKSKEDISI